MDKVINDLVKRIERLEKEIIFLKDEVEKNKFKLSNCMENSKIFFEMLFKDKNFRNWINSEKKKMDK